MLIFQNYIFEPSLLCHRIFKLLLIIQIRLFPPHPSHQVPLFKITNLNLANYLINHESNPSQNPTS